MKDSDEKQQDKKQGGISPIAAGVTGAVIGAGIAVAGVMAMQDESNRKKVKNAVKSVKNKASDIMDDVKKQTQEKKEEIEKKIAEGKEKVQKVTNAAKDAIDTE